MLDHCAKSATKDAILLSGNKTSMGVFIDDPKNVNSLAELIVDFYEGSTKKTIARGNETLHSAMYLASNDVLKPPMVTAR